MRRYFWVAIVGLGVMFTAGCRSQRPAGPVVSQAVVPLPAGSFTSQWTASLELPANDTVEQLWLRNGLLLAKTHQNAIYQFDAASGTLQAVIKPVRPGVDIGAPIVTQDEVIWPISTQLQVYSRRGYKQATIDLGHSVSAGVAHDGNRLFVPVHYFKLSAGRIMAIDVDKSLDQEVWQLQRGTSIVSTPVVRDHILYAADSGGDVFAVSTTNDRMPIWIGDHVFHTYGAVVAGLDVDDYGLYVASTDTTLYCLDRDSAKIKWQWLSGQRLVDAPVVIGNTVFQPLPGNRLAAIDKVSEDPQGYNRKARWQVNARKFVAADAAHVYVLGLDQHLVALNLQTGNPVFRSARGDFAAVSVNPESAVIYTATKDGHITAVTPVLTAGRMGAIQ